jgi:hypothetical protein
MEQETVIATGGCFFFRFPDGHTVTVSAPSAEEAIEELKRQGQAER